MHPKSETLLTTSRFRVERITQEADDGSQHERTVVRHPGAVTVLPILDDGRICLIRNYRVAVDETLVELPAGTLEDGEAPEQTAYRELIEETGYQAGQLIAMPPFFLSPGILDERMHLFRAQQLKWVGAAREAGEQIQNLIVDWDEAIAMVLDGRIHDAKTIVGLLHHDRFRNSE